MNHSFIQIFPDILTTNDALMVHAPFDLDSSSRVMTISACLLAASFWARQAGPPEVMGVHW